MNKYFLPLIFLSMLGCSTHSLLSEKDAIKMSDNEIRSLLLEQTPVGMKEADVRKIMLQRFNRRLSKDGVFDRQQVVDASNSDKKAGAVRYELHDYWLSTGFASYGWAKHFFLSGTNVDASWLFNKDGILKDITVCHCWDGV